MDGKKKIWATAVLCAVASVGFIVPAGAEETMTHDLDEVIVEADRNTLPGGFVANNDRVGILGNIKAIDVPFTQKKYTEKTIMTFYDPNQPLNGTLANTPSIRIAVLLPCIQISVCRRQYECFSLLHQRYSQYVQPDPQHPGIYPQQRRYSLRP